MITPSTPRLSAPQGGSGGGYAARVRFVLMSALVAVLVSGCVVRIVYNQMDWLALWYADSYLNLDDRQKEQARELISRTIAWHRSTQLPRYMAVSQTVRDQVDSDPVSAAFIADRYDEIVGLWDDLLGQVAVDAGILLQSLSDRQVDDLFEKLAEDNREFEKEYSGATLAKRRERQDKAIIRMFRRFTGRLSSEQETLIRSRTAELHDLSGEWLQRRAAWQAEFRQALADRKADPQFATRLADLLLNPNQFDSPVYRRRVDENRQRVFAMIAEVLGTLSPAQVQVLRKRLTGYMQDFAALMSQGPGRQQTGTDDIVGVGAEERT